MTAFDSGKGMFDSDAQARDGAVDRFPNGIQGFSPGFFARHPTSNLNFTPPSKSIQEKAIHF
jgi:hypothetical protein